VEQVASKGKLEVVDGLYLLDASSLSSSVSVPVEAELVA